MNVLILDDQKTVLEGMKSGIPWARNGITNLYLATSVAEAKHIFSQNEIHILFCDIEMPEENGISLVEWVVNQYPSVINIFLTSHADFYYARSAVALGVFDYILQPASYDDIEKTLQKAVEKWNLNHRLSQLYKYGRYIERKKTAVTETLCYELLNDRINNYDRLFTDLGLLNYHFTKDMRYLLVLFHLLDDQILNIWTEEECQWSVENILQELVEHIERDGLLYSSKWSGYYVIFSEIDEATAEQHCKEILETLNSVLPSRIACYAGTPVSIQELPGSFDRLNSYMKNNVFLQEGYFDPDSVSTFIEKRVELTDSTYAYWRTALEHGRTGIIYKEVQRYLNQLIETKQANFSTMLDFHQKLSQLFLHILSLRNQDLSRIFTGEYTYSDFSEGYQTIHDLQKTVDFIFHTLSSISAPKEISLSYVNQAKEYVLSNISENIRVQEIAEHIGLTPDYLSRHFKRRTGVSLKDYILSIKVETAKQYLETTNHSVSTIATNLGYDNVSNFIQTFKKSTGLTPNEYKKAVSLSKRN